MTLLLSHVMAYLLRFIVIVKGLATGPWLFSPIHVFVYAVGGQLAPTHEDIKA